MKNKRTEIFIMAIILIIQTIIYVCVSMQKSYLHIDEAYSFGLTNYDKMEIQDNTDFFNTWHENEYFEDYLAVQDDEKWDFTPVYENQKNDVHPPFYYLLLHIAMGFTNGQASKWAGIILNCIIYAFVTIVMYFITKRILKDEKNANKKALLLTFMSSIILASISNVIYIRMYALLTLEILITTLLHMKLFEKKTIKPGIYIAISISVLAGILTHYYYLFYLLAIYLVFAIRYIKKKNKKSLLYYTLTMLISGIISLIIFPYSIQHMFFGYRGQGVISNLKDFTKIIPGIFSQSYTVDYYVFHYLLIPILIIIIGCILYKKIRKEQLFTLNKEQKDILKILYIPTIFFFLITSIASPWKVLRYIVPVCGLIFVLVMYYLYKLLQCVFREKIGNIMMCIVFCSLLITPFVFHLEPELLYSNRKEFMQEIKNDLNLPALYVFDSKRGGFLDDILPFSILDNSYIAKDIEISQDTLQNIFDNMDISNGILIFINQEQNNDMIATQVMQALHFSSCNHLQKLSSCDVYYLHF